ncbi:MAG TPA: L-ribulose-5-phosphate 4-epimerase AraD, partial [Phycisphaerae bacterium]|nr:L-ribulose-5-phosphate 4-epimerase AraD [Phycisphaerae bacterium]
QLKQTVFDVNMALQKSGLVVLTWGNASGVDRAAGVMAIKPSGVKYDKLTAADIVVLEIATGKTVEGTKNPSSDTPTHLHLYQQFPNIGGVVHTHSQYATTFAQAHREIPCLGTTHADHFYGTVPCTRPMTAEEIKGEYELNTGKVIVERFQKGGIDPDDVPGVLVASHAPFVWGATPQKALENAIALESIALMQLGAYQLNPKVESVPQVLLDKHFKRKHGPGAYYGQK